MTRKDYVLLAEACERSKPIGGPSEEKMDYQLAYDQWQRQTRRISESLKQDNPHFELRRFLKACGLSVC